MVKNVTPSALRPMDRAVLDFILRVCGDASNVSLTADDTEYTRRGRPKVVISVRGERHTHDGVRAMRRKLRIVYGFTADDMYGAEWRAERILEAARQYVQSKTEGGTGG